jgi:MerR HTH family regulatory protein
VADLVADLDLTPILTTYGGVTRGTVPYDPRMLVAVLRYAYAVGVPAPQGMETSGWRFRAADLTCACRVARLERDFGATVEAAAEMIDLLDEIEQLRARLKRAGLDVE